MTALEFKNYLDKEYLFDKILDYILAVLILSGGLFFLYKLLLTEWSSNLSLGLFVVTLIISIYCIYLGAVGFYRIPNVTEIYFITNNDGKENNKKRIYNLSSKFNFFI